MSNLADRTDAAVDVVDSDEIAPSEVPPRWGWVRRAVAWTVRAAVLGATVSVFGLSALVRPDHWLVEHVEFRGTQRASAVELRHLVDMPNGTTMWGVNPEAAARGAERHPWVRKARAWRELPDTLVVEVDEHVPVALLLADKLYYVDGEGNAFLEARADDVDYPVVTGVDPDLGAQHPDLPKVVMHDALALIDALDERGLVARADVSEVGFSAARGFTLVLRRHAAARLVFGLDSRERQIDRLSQLVGDGLDLTKPVLVDLAPARIAIVRPLGMRETSPGT